MMTSYEENLQNLPKLPVPKLEDTLRRYIESLKPLVSKEELENTIKLVEEFRCSDTALKLQNYIEKRAKEKLNWCQEWFITDRYLENRHPTAVYGSPVLMFPLEDFNSEDDRLVYTVKLILAAVSYKTLIDSNKLPVDKSGDAELDMHQYSRLFGACRIPSHPFDKQEFYSKSEHIIVAYKNQFYKLQLISNSKLIGGQQLFKHLKTILSDRSGPGIPIGILTTEQKDTWATLHHDLMKENDIQIKEIESSLFIVCLDEPVPKNNSTNKMTKAGKQLVHGDGSEMNSGNRWFDKAIQFVIGNDGIVGIVYEHSFSDGQVIGNVANYIVNLMQNIHENNFKDGDNDGAGVPLKLSFQINDSMLLHIKTASDNYNKSVENSDIEWFKFELYGKNFIKTVKLSPDSYVQMALQLAFYKLHKQPAVSYEAVGTRKYAKAGTESFRSFSKESVSFSKINSTEINIENLTALKLAINTHKKNCIEATLGYATERHFMGLKIAAKEMGIEIPTIFADTSFVKSTSARLATSQVATKCDAVMGFGTKPDDLYAICYNIRDNDINFALYSFKTNPDTNTKQYKNCLIASLSEMKNILLQSY